MLSGFFLCFRSGKNKKRNWYKKNMNCAEYCPIFKTKLVELLVFIKLLKSAADETDEVISLFFFFFQTTKTYKCLYLQFLASIPYFWDCVVCFHDKVNVRANDEIVQIFHFWTACTHNRQKIASFFTKIKISKNIKRISMLVVYTYCSNVVQKWKLWLTYNDPWIFFSSWKLAGIF